VYSLDICSWISNHPNQLPRSTNKYSSDKITSQVGRTPDTSAPDC